MTTVSSIDASSPAPQPRAPLPVKPARDEPHVHCCGLAWAGVERAHCCGRDGYRGCGHVFDTALLFDAHRRGGRCVEPRALDLLQAADGVWLAVMTPPPLT